MAKHQDPLPAFWLAIVELHMCRGLPNLKIMDGPWREQLDDDTLLFVTSHDAIVHNPDGEKFRLHAQHAHVFRDWAPVITASPEEAAVLDDDAAVLEEVTQLIYATIEGSRNGKNSVPA